MDYLKSKIQKDENDFSIQDSGDNEESFRKSDDKENHDCDVEDVLVNDYVVFKLIYDKGTKKHDKFFIGQILEVHDDRIKMKCMKKRNFSFYFPTIDNIQQIKKTEICRKFRIFLSEEDY